MKSPRTAIAILILGAQLILIAWSRTTMARYFCWAPFDMQTDYSVDVTLHGRKLTAQEIRQRYRRPAKGTDNRSVQNLIDIFQGYEERYAGPDKAEIRLRYRINGKEQQEWRYPR
ncbi:MAG: hypothetical protein HY820_23970 [Acidobacteria bacterium]|nr:hypothetical protein [Acidobacteriota bacterium]